MQPYHVRVLSINKITNDVLQIHTAKPDNYNFRPGQATDVSINKKAWENEKRPFTFTSLPDNDYLEFTIKTYPLHNGLTKQFLSLKKDDELILHEVFGDIAYKGEGVFIAGGAGVTPFISIFRYLDSIHEIGSNKLIFANKTKGDIILEQEFKKLLGDNFINILSDDRAMGYANGQISENFLKAYAGGMNKLFYVCGPPPMMNAVVKQLMNLKVNKKSIIKESF